MVLFQRATHVGPVARSKWSICKTNAGTPMIFTYGWRCHLAYLCASATPHTGYADLKENYYALHCSTYPAW